MDINDLWMSRRSAISMANMDARLNKVSKSKGAPAWRSVASDWFDEGVMNDDRWMLVVSNNSAQQFESHFIKDVPREVYWRTHKTIQNDPARIIMEVYDLHQDKKEQFGQERPFSTP